MRIMLAVPSSTNLLHRLRCRALRRFRATQTPRYAFSMKQPCSARCNQLSLRAPAFRVVKVVMSFGKLSSKITASTSNLLQLHFLRELLVELTQLLDQVLASVDDCLLWCDFAICLNSKLEGGEEWVRDLVAGEEDVVCFGELCAKEVAECVVFLVECEHRGIGDAFEVSM